MVKILLKTIILVFIILSIYFIVNPSACSNFMMGRVTNVTDTQPTQELLPGEHEKMFVPSGDKPLAQPYQGSSSTAAGVKSYSADESQAYPMQDNAPVVGITDTNTMKEPAMPTYSQDDIDYAVASRYVELEQEYAKLNKTGKDTAKEISSIVMDDFELTQQEWEAFLERATASNLFNKVRTDLSAKQNAEK